MYNIFKPQRFGKLFMKFTAEQYKSYLMSLGVLIGILLLGGIFLVYMLNARMEIGLQLLLLAWVIFFAGTVFTSMIFTQLGDPKKAISALTLPATHFEKFLVAWIYSFVILLVVVIPCFYLVMLFLLNIRHFPGPQEEIFNLFQPINGSGGNILLFLLVLYGLFHSIALYGAIYFKKLHFIKTALVFFLTIAILLIGNSIYMHQLIHRDIEQTIPFAAVRFRENGQSLIVNPVGFVWLGQLVYFILALFFWTAAYFRLKEKQV
jgi:hypothetical protein